MTTNTGTESVLAPNWRHVGAFLGLTFGLTCLLDLAIYLRGGLRMSGIVATLQLQMLLPAFSAIVLGLFFFRESPLYYKRPAGRSRWFYYYYLLVSLIYALGALSIWISPSQRLITILSTVPLILAILGLVILIALRIASGREAMARVWLAWGNWRYWLVFALAIVAFFILQAALNAVTGLGGKSLAALPSPPGMSTGLFLALAAVQSVILAPILAILIGFGEEFGWRGYLQSELFKMGRTRGVLLVGLIWAAWHWPLILMGYNYPGYPLLGLLLMVFFTTCIAVVLGYAVLRSGSVLLAAYLHALIDQMLSFLSAIGFRPHNPVFSFYIGIYGILTLAIVAFFILRDPIWRGRGSSLYQPEEADLAEDKAAA